MGFILAAFLFAWGVVPSTAQPVQPQRSTVVMEIAAIDVFQRTVTLLDPWGRAVQMHVRPGAEIRNAKESTVEFRTLDDLKPGFRVQVSFTGALDDPDTVMITILPGQEDRKRESPGGIAIVAPAY